ncbi:hypothetical protein [Actinomadura sp. DC4]|uniref:hypothetical protein n=1 Tax=Actinomadura sp. DC4 TaxID=3055069 RepID=UPI0025AFE57C|nr:hypothetical protein [Actinomadura sp. DC4]MDN3355426.1 hypothetical protein [Actinomadura sp. DC4]
MTTMLGKHAATVTTALVIGGLGAIAAQAPAQASGFSAAFTCNISNFGQTPAILNGWLSSPGTTFSGPASFRLRISSLSLQAPIPIDSWSATAWINVRGAENTAFQVSGVGGAVPPQGAISGDLAGVWAPYVRGTDVLSVGGIELTANSAEAGNVSVQCVPNGAPVAEVLRVASPYHGWWHRPAAPVFRAGGWYRPGMVLHRPIWIRPGRPGWNHPVPPVPGGPGWNHPVVPVHPIVPVPGRPGWNNPRGPVHPIVPAHPGGWNHPGMPVPGRPGWNNPRGPVHPIVPAHPGGWNRPGTVNTGGPIGVPGHFHPGH